MIGFLGIDTDGGIYTNSIVARDGSNIRLDASEQMPICVQNPRLIYSRTPEKFSWLPECNVGSLDTLTKGAGAVRSNGRFALTCNEEDLAYRLQSKISQINSAEIINNDRYSLLSSEVEVHMVFSLGGGTGCGTFINMAYLTALTLPGIKISGYAVLPDIFRAMMHGAGMSRVVPNGMGAIRDLDYLMSMNAGSEPITVKWLKEERQTNMRPFDAFYFIDNKNANNDTFTDIDRLCEMLSLALVTSLGELSVAADSISDNVSKNISSGTMDIRNKLAWASGFGVSEILFNGDILAEIYAQKARQQLITKMLNGGCDDPAVIANTWIDNTRIRENLGKDDVIDYFMSAAPERTFDDLDDLSNPMPECRDFIDRMALPKAELMNEKLDALQLRVQNALDSLVREQLQRECGVYNVEQALHTILTQTELCDAEMKSETDELLNVLPKHESALETSCRELADCTSIFARGRRTSLAEEVCENTMTVARTRREIKRRELTRQFYNWLRSRVQDKFAAVNNIIANLNAVRDESNRRVMALIQNIGRASFFQFDLAVEYADKVACPAQEVVFNDFISFMAPVGGVLSLAEMTSAQAGSKLLDFTLTLPKVKEYKDMTVDMILDKLSDEAFEQLCVRAVKKAMPLFNYNYHGYDADVNEKPVDIFYIGVADKKKSRLAKGDKLKSLVPDVQTVQFSSTGIPDRVIIYRQVGVVPPFCLTALDAYESEYERVERDKKGTSHWDADLCERMTRERYNLAPGETFDRKKALESWTQAIVAGVITRSEAKNRYQIKSKELGGMPITGYKVDMGATREDAFNFFVDNFDVTKGLVERELERLSDPATGNVLREKVEAARKAAADGTYVAEVSLCPIPVETLIEYGEGRYKAELDLINQELDYINSL